MWTSNFALLDVYDVQSVKIGSDETEKPVYDMIVVSSTLIPNVHCAEALAPLHQSTSMRLRLQLHMYSNSVCSDHYLSIDDHDPYSRHHVCMSIMSALGILSWQSIQFKTDASRLLCFWSSQCVSKFSFRFPHWHEVSYQVHLWQPPLSSRNGCLLP